MKSRYLKKILTSMLAVPFGAAAGMPVFYKSNARKAPELRFGKDGKFRILHITDIHEVDPEMDDDPNVEIPVTCSLETVNVIKESIERANPDLVVFGGDNISGYWQEFTYDYVEKTIDKITKPVREKNIPFAIVFGNHDSEIRKFFREFQMLCYMRYDNFIGTLNAEEMHGVGSQNIVVKSGKSDKAAFNIWLVDSNDYPHDETGRRIDGYDHIHKDQLDWYERTAEKLKAENGGEPLPSILFQHIPVAQEYDALIKADENTEGAVKRGDDYYIINENHHVSGVMRETPCVPANKDRTQFDLWKKHGDVFAAFFGHDHVNNFIFDVDGIKLVQTYGAGYHTYGDRHGARLIVIDENKPREFETEDIIVERITDVNLD